MTPNAQDQLVLWIIGELPGGHLSGANLVDVCADATSDLGWPVSIDDYVEASLDGRIPRTQVRVPAPPPAPAPQRPQLKPLATPLAELPIEDARKAIIERVVDATMLVCGVTRSELVAPGQGFRAVSAARNIVAFTLAGLMPDEKVHGLAMLLSQHVGRSDQAWHKRLDRAACTTKPRLAALQARVDDLLDDIEPLRGVVYRKPGRPRKVLVAAEASP